MAHLFPSIWTCQASSFQLPGILSPPSVHPQRQVVDQPEIMRRGVSLLGGRIISTRQESTCAASVKPGYEITVWPKRLVSNRWSPWKTTTRPQSLETKSQLCKPRNWNCEFVSKSSASAKRSSMLILRGPSFRLYQRDFRIFFPSRTSNHTFTAMIQTIRMRLQIAFGTSIQPHLCWSSRTCRFQGRGPFKSSSQRTTQNGR